jgi:hypothetical protein
MSGSEVKVFGGKLLTGYELQFNGSIVAVVDILDNNIWITNKLEPEKKLILASISSAILLKRMQDVQKDRESLDQWVFLFNKIKSDSSLGKGFINYKTEINIE